MSSDKQNITPPINIWFSTNIGHEGYGWAEFQEPKGTIKGSVKIQFDELGNSKIEMDVESCEAEQPLRFGLLEFFSAEKPVNEGDRIGLSPSPGSNPCISLTVTTPEGTYSATGKIIYNPIIALVGTKSRIQFYLITSQFDVTGAGVAKYWVLPLFNFISEFQQRHLDLEHHPLRIRPKSNNPANTNADHLITFEFNGDLGFIEPLVDFKERKDRLYSGQVQRLITAVMVGEVGSESINIPNLRGWLPFGFLPLLSLATGSEVGIPWIEFRDANGGLVRRIHDNFGKPQFSKGHTTISEVAHQGTGYLLTRAQYSPNYGKAPLGSAVFNLVQAGSNSLTIEDKLNKICCAFDSLCEYYGLSVQNLLRDLDTNHQDIVKKALKSAAQDIRSAATATSDYIQKQLLIKIADKTINASNTDRDFGIAVIDLIKQFNLPDADIINDHYLKNPRPDGRTTWSGILSHYRGLAVHRGYFEFQAGTYDVKDVVRITYHLYDILVRIVFRMLEYDRTYQPIVVRVATQMPVDWVTSALPAIRLGY